MVNSRFLENNVGLNLYICDVKLNEGCCIHGT